MNPKRRTGYGVFDISRAVARRVQKEWEMVESPTLPVRLTSLVLPQPSSRPDDESRRSLPAGRPPAFGCPT